MPDDPLNLDAGLLGPADNVHRIAKSSGIAPDIADDYLKLAQIESGQRQSVRSSSKGALGFGQVMPDVKGGKIRTVGDKQYDLTNEDQNIEAGLRYFNEGGDDPVGRRLYYFGGPKARQHYERTGAIPNISDGNLTAAQYVKATGGQRPAKPADDDGLNLDAGLVDEPQQPKVNTKAAVSAVPGMGTVRQMRRRQQPVQQPAAQQPKTFADVMGPSAPVDAGQGASLRQPAPRQVTSPSRTGVFNNSLREAQASRLVGSGAAHATTASNADPMAAYKVQLGPAANPAIADESMATAQAQQERRENPLDSMPAGGFPLTSDLDRPYVEKHIEAQKEYSRRSALNAQTIAQTKQETRKLIQQQGGWTPEVDKWLTESLAEAQAHAGDLVAGGVKAITFGHEGPSFNYWWGRSEGIRQAIEEESKGRSEISKQGQAALAGLLSPEIIASGLSGGGTAAAATAFGIGGGLGALGRGAPPADVATETGVGIGTGYLFGAPPVGGNAVARAASKAGIVGAGTYAMTGDPASAASNAAFAATGPLFHGEGRGTAEKLGVPRGETTVPSAALESDAAKVQSAANAAFERTGIVPQEMRLGQEADQFGAQLEQQRAGLANAQQPARMVDQSAITDAVAASQKPRRAARKAKPGVMVDQGAIDEVTGPQPSLPVDTVPREVASPSEEPIARITHGNKTWEKRADGWYFVPEGGKPFKVKNASTRVQLDREAGTTTGEEGAVGRKNLAEEDDVQELGDIDTQPASNVSAEAERRASSQRFMDKTEDRLARNTERKLETEDLEPPQYRDDGGAQWYRDRLADPSLLDKAIYLDLGEGFLEPAVPVGGERKFGNLDNPFETKKEAIAALSRLQASPEDFPKAKIVKSPHGYFLEWGEVPKNYRNLSDAQKSKLYGYSDEALANHEYITSQGDYTLLDDVQDLGERGAVNPAVFNPIEWAKAIVDKFRGEEDAPDARAAVQAVRDSGLNINDATPAQIKQALAGHVFRKADGSMVPLTDELLAQVEPAIKTADHLSSLKRQNARYNEAQDAAKLEAIEKPAAVKVVKKATRTAFTKDREGNPVVPQKPRAKKIAEEPHPSVIQARDEKGSFASGSDYPALKTELTEGAKAIQARAAELARHPGRNLRTATPEQAQEYFNELAKQVSIVAPERMGDVITAMEAYNAGDMVSAKVISDKAFGERKFISKLTGAAMAADIAARGGEGNMPMLKQVLSDLRKRMAAAHGDERGFIRNPFADEKPSLEKDIDELVKLHIHPARQKDFIVSDAQVGNYIKRLRELTDRYVPTSSYKLDEAQAKLDRHRPEQAIIDAEIALQMVHSTLSKANGKFIDVGDIVRSKYKDQLGAVGEQHDQPPQIGKSGAVEDRDAADAEGKRRAKRSLPKTLAASNREPGTDLEYDMLPNAESRQVAAKRIAEQGVEKTHEWLADAPPSAERTSAFIQLSDRYLEASVKDGTSAADAKALRDKGVELANQEAPRATELGQTIQAFAQLNKYGPTESLLAATKLADEAGQKLPDAVVKDIVETGVEFKKADEQLKEVRKELATAEKEVAADTKATGKKGAVEGGIATGAAGEGDDAATVKRRARTRRVEQLRDQQEKAIARRRVAREKQIATLAKLETKTGNYYLRANQIVRGSMVSAIPTAIRNAESQVGRFGVERLTDIFAHALRKAAGQDSRLPNLWRDTSRIADSRSTGLARQVSSEYAPEMKRLFNDYALGSINDVMGADNQFKKTTALGRGFERTFQTAERFTRWANTANQIQEFHIRGAEFLAHLDLQVERRYGKTLEQFLREKGGDKIPKELISDSVDHALEVTFADLPAGDTATGRAMRSAISLSNWIPPTLSPVPFGRWFYNSWKFMYQYSPIGVADVFRTPRQVREAQRAVLRVERIPEAKTEAGEARRQAAITKANDQLTRATEYAKNERARSVSKALIGTAMLGTAYALRSSQYAGEKWYEVKIPAEELAGMVGLDAPESLKDKYVDARPFAPFSLYLFLAEGLRRHINHERPFSKTEFAAAIGASTPASGDIESLYDKYRSGDFDGTFRMLKGMGGDVAGALLTPVRQIKTVIGQFDKSEAVTNETRNAPLLGPAAESIPYASKAVGLKPAYRPTSEEPIHDVAPGIKFLTGARVITPKNFIEKELDRLRFDSSEVKSSSGVPEADTIENRYMGQFVAQQAKILEKNSSYQKASDAMKAAGYLQPLLAGARQYARAKMAAERPDLYRQLIEKKEPARQKDLKKSLGISQTSPIPPRKPGENDTIYRARLLQAGQQPKSLYNSPFNV